MIYEIVQRTRADVPLSLKNDIESSLSKIDLTIRPKKKARLLKETSDVTYKLSCFRDLFFMN